jgi:hypothetical protein
LRGHRLTTCTPVISFESPAITSFFRAYSRKSETATYIANTRENRGVDSDSPYIGGTRSCSCRFNLPKRNLRITTAVHLGIDR